MTQRSRTLSIEIGDHEGIDDEDRERLAHDLAEELRELDGTELIDGPAGRAPAGSKGGGLVWGTIFVRLAEFGATSGLASALVAWLGRDRGRTVTVQVGDDRLELTGVSARDQQRIAAWFESRVGAEG